MTLLPGEDEGMNLSHWLAVVKAKMQALFQLPHVPRIRPGLMPVRKTVRRGGRTHEQTYYVRPARRTVFSTGISTARSPSFIHISDSTRRTPTTPAA
ncbi:hypothetical protein, partial [Thermus scotoductus]|uniref:hypothetical protein n=1 Tax=Thermus scotoductus TaxID=37636 RepID=UPI001000C178